MSTEDAVTTATQAVSTKKPLKPARKQVKPGQVTKNETPQTGKEYSKPTMVIHIRWLTHKCARYMV